ncbi:MAG: AAA family ATPase [Desulfoarculaceae bacterium]|nr:AAA family ATPase [Desulfoarculaceae bacterium]
MQKGFIEEQLQGIVERVTYHNIETGWSVLRVKCFNEHDAVPVTVHQTRVFAGATMKFFGSWAQHPTFGRQFKAVRAEEQKPATAAGLEKYLGSGLIKGVGPKTARKIVGYFGRSTLDIFEERIEDLLLVPGIAQKKLAGIKTAWEEHRMVREVMLFLQGHGISTLFAVRIYKKYGDQAVSLVQENPYRLADDFYGIGFFSADKVALSLGISLDSELRIKAAIRHILAASREQGHCFLTSSQIMTRIRELLEMDLADRLELYLQSMEQDNLLKTRFLEIDGIAAVPCYYSKTLYYEERNCAERLRQLCVPIAVDEKKVTQWLRTYSESQSLQLSAEQYGAVAGIASRRCAILTGGPGCGKTTTTKTLVRLFQAMGLAVTLAAPTGRAAQRMGEVIGSEAKTIHRLLEYQGGGFKRNREQPLVLDCLVVDECSMLDISLTAALLDAIPEGARLVLIGDADQLPSVGAGNVLADLIASRVVPVFTLNKVFRQAEESSIIRYAHAINNGAVPQVPSPFKQPGLWREKADCLFLDSNEATKEQLRVIARVRDHFKLSAQDVEAQFGAEHLFTGIEEERLSQKKGSELDLPDKYSHVNFGLLQTAENSADELRSVLKKVHPWSSLYYGLTAQEVIVRLYTEWVPKYFGIECEIQVLSPMTRGSLGTATLNRTLQQAVNPAAENKGQLILGERIFRVGDRVIHRRNNYDLGVFNGDIGTVSQVNALDLTCVVRFFAGGREVEYQKDEISELDLAYAVTIHKSQGSEFDCVIIPVVSQHFKMLFRNLVYTGLTRARKLAVFVGTRQAFTMAVGNLDTASRQTALAVLLRAEDGNRE